jgi:DNA invertase Pin-like site-specific DNA recombinase
MKKVPESQVSALKKQNSQRKQDTAERVNKAIDKLKRKNASINFETVAKESGVSRATLYNNTKLKERIMGLRAMDLTPTSEGGAEPKKTKVQRLEATVAELRARVRQLEADKKNLIVQLVDYEETKAENERLRRQSLKGVNREE